MRWFQCPCTWVCHTPCYNSHTRTQESCYSNRFFSLGVDSALLKRVSSCILNVFLPEVYVVTSSFGGAVKPSDIQHAHTHLHMHISYTTCTYTHTHIHTTHTYTQHTHTHTHNTYHTCTNSTCMHHSHIHPPMHTHSQSHRHAEYTVPFSCSELFQLTGHQPWWRETKNSASGQSSDYRRFKLWTALWLHPSHVPRPFPQSWFASSIEVQRGKVWKISSRVVS